MHGTIRAAPIRVRGVVVVGVASRVDIPILLLDDLFRRVVISATSHVSMSDYIVSSDCCISAEAESVRSVVVGAFASEALTFSGVSHDQNGFSLAVYGLSRHDADVYVLYELERLADRRRQFWAYSLHPMFI